jgi:hypothetical protein
MHSQNKQLDEQLRDALEHNQLLVNDLDRLQEIQNETELELEWASNRVEELEQQLSGQSLDLEKQTSPLDQDSLQHEQIERNESLVPHDLRTGLSSDSLALQHLQEEFAQVALQASKEIHELQEKVQLQQDQIETFQNREKVSKSEIERRPTKEKCNVPTQTDDDITQSFIQNNSSRSFSMNQSQIGFLPPPLIAISVSSQTYLRNLQDVSLQTDEYQQPVSKSTDKLIDTESVSTEPIISAKEYIDNKARYIQELKERNLLLVRISQYLDNACGFEQKSVASFTMLKQVLLEKVKAVGNLHELKV